MISVVVGVSLLGQDTPPDKQSIPQALEKRVRVSPRVLDGLVANRILPQPPWSNDKGHKKGIVTIAVLVDNNGTVKSTSTLSGDPVLADVAMNAIKQWQFKPYIIQGEPVQVESRVVMKFGKKSAEMVVGKR